jgi:hypothetical protein
MKTIEEEFPPADQQRMIDLQVTYTRLRARAVEMEQALQWRPIADVPLKTDVLLYWPAKMGRTLRPAQQTVGQVASLCHYAGATHFRPLPPALDLHQTKP